MSNMIMYISRQHVCSVCVSLCMWKQYRNILECQSAGQGRWGRKRGSRSLIRCVASLMTQLLPSTSCNKGNTQPQEDRAGPAPRPSQQHRENWIEIHWLLSNKAYILLPGFMVTATPYVLKKHWKSHCNNRYSMKTWTETFFHLWVPKIAQTILESFGLNL